MASYEEMTRDEFIAISSNAPHGEFDWTGFYAIGMPHPLSLGFWSWKTNTDIEALRSKVIEYTGIDPLIGAVIRRLLRRKMPTRSARS